MNIEWAKVKGLIEETDLDENDADGHEFEEFKRAVQPPQTGVHTARLTVRHVATRRYAGEKPVSGGWGDKPLIDFNQLILSVGGSSVGGGGLCKGIWAMLFLSR